MKAKYAEAQVEVEDAILEEYDVQYSENEDNGAGYIVSQEGKRFKVLLHNHERDTTLSCWLYMDGAVAARRIVYAESSVTIQGVSVNDENIRPFEFSRLRLTDDDGLLNTSTEEPNLEHMGTLQCDFFRVRDVRDEQPSAKQHTYTLPSAITDDLVLHEKTKKAGSHRIQLGQETIKSKTNPVTVTYVDVTTGPPYVSLIFRYRPKEMLQAQGIISSQPKNDRKRAAGPNDAGPSKRARAGSATPQEGDEEDDVKPEVAEEQLQTLLAERAALEARIQAAEARRVKREPSPIVLGAASGEVIDLTDD